jgi:hypothetical protein
MGKRIRSRERPNVSSRRISPDGALTGYAGGLAAKRWLLAHESHKVDRVNGKPLVPPCAAL